MIVDNDHKKVYIYDNEDMQDDNPQDKLQTIVEGDSSMSSRAITDSKAHSDSLARGTISSAFKKNKSDDSKYNIRKQVSDSDCWEVESDSDNTFKFRMPSSKLAGVVTQVSTLSYNSNAEKRKANHVRLRSNSISQRNSGHRSEEFDTDIDELPEASVNNEEANVLTKQEYSRSTDSIEKVRKH